MSRSKAPLKAQMRIRAGIAKRERELRKTLPPHLFATVSAIHGQFLATGGKTQIRAKTLAKQCGCSTRTIWRRLAALRKAGILETERVTSKWGDLEASIYRLKLPEGGTDTGGSTYVRARTPKSLRDNEGSLRRHQGGRRRRLGAAPPADGGKWTHTYSFFDSLKAGT